MGDDTYHGGAFMLAANFGFYTSFKPMQKPSRPPKSRIPYEMGTPDGYAFYLNAGPTANLDKIKLDGVNPLFADQLYHTTFDDYWKVRDLSRHMHNIHCAVMTVGGWFDAEDSAGPLRTYSAIEKENPGIPNTIVEGPWVHGGWANSDGDHLGDAVFNAKTSEYFRKEIQFPFFEFYLKGKGHTPPEAYMFETGTNVWQKYDQWPPKAAEPKLLYLRSGGKLSFEERPVENGNKAYDQYASDPARPVPFVEYTTDTVPQRYMVDDQRWAARRTDVLTYMTDPLKENITIAGPISPKLKISSSGTDSDFVVKLIDVYPEDYPDPPETSSGNKRILGAPPLHLDGYQQLFARRTDARQVSAELGKTGGAHSGQNDRIELRNARSASHVPNRPPHHDTDSEFVVPTRRPKPANVCRYPARETRGLQSSHRTRVPPRGSLQRSGVDGASSALTVLDRISLKPTRTIP
jgi:predicted acyl esterase